MVADHPGSLSRRALLGGVAGLATAGALPTAAAGDGDLTVMTRNLYVGVDLFELVEAEDLDDVRTIAGRLLEDARAHPYRARAGALAEEVRAVAPDVVGVQEAALIRTREPSEFDGAHDPGASDVEVDLLELLVSELDALGLDYEVAAETVTNDVEVPADLDGGDREVDVRLTDRTAVLVRQGVETGATHADRFDAALEIPLETVSFSLRRGYSGVDVTIDGRPVTVATTHLESVSPAVRRDQARELLEVLPSDRPVVLAGDVNSGPGRLSDTYEILLESFEDAHAAVSPDAEAATCCYDADLRDDTGELSRRLDVVLYRGGLEAVEVHRVGVGADDRASASVDGESVRLWPSDHAGVVASFELAAAGAATPIGSPTDEASPSGTTVASPVDQPGMGVLAGLGGAALAACARLAGGE